MVTLRYCVEVSTQENNETITRDRLINNEYSSFILIFAKKRPLSNGVYRVKWG
jgi:methionine-rich copper-binding protein CopC